VQKADRIVKLAGELGVTPAQLAIAWCLGNPNVSTVILGASKLSQLEENLAALDKPGPMSEEIREKIEEILQNRPEGPVRY
jgi:aryl-alcohol dehydrogenase-like predicted oxidoreductase